jgi:hypothetical protein
VTVSETLSIDDFGFYLQEIPAGTVDFFIYDLTTPSVTMGSRAVSAPSRGWDYLTGLDVELTGGHTYYFGVYDATSALWVGSAPGASFFSDGLGIPGGSLSAPVSSLDFSGDAPTGTAGAADLALRIYSTDDVAPEPNSLILLGTGILAGAAILRRKVVK